MFDDDQQLKLNKAAMEVFGTMYFTPIELLPEAPGQDEWNLEETYVKASIGYTGPYQASIVFYFPGSLSANIAEGFLGEDSSILTEIKIVDTMREAANMIIGNFLGRLDLEGACSLGVPDAEMVTGFSPAKVAGQGKLMAFMSDFGFLWMLVA